MEQRTDTAVDATFDTTSVDATPLQIERAKVHALSKQLARSAEEKRRLKRLLEKTQTDLELQLKTTLRLQKQQAKKCLQDAEEKQVPPSDDARELKLRLASTQNELAEEIHASRRREEKIQQLQDQCRGYRDQLEQLKKQHGGQEGQDLKKLVKNLEHQRTELVAVVKKQTRLIEILQQKQAHVEAAALLNIAEKDFRTAVKS